MPFATTSRQRVCRPDQASAEPCHPSTYRMYAPGSVALRVCCTLQMFLTIRLKKA